MGRNIKDQDIIRFIDELPGGSVPQYARLLATTPTRINRMLNDNSNKGAKRLILQKKVMAPLLGLRPDWASDDHPRGELDAENLKSLPKFVNELLDQMHPTYRDDGLILFKTLIEMASGRKNFEQGVTDITEMYSDIGHHVAGLETQLEDRRQRLLLLEQETAFWQKSIRDVAESNDITLPPMMTRELQISDLRKTREKLDERAEENGLNDDEGEEVQTAAAAE